MVDLEELFPSENELETVFPRGSCPKAQGEGLITVIMRVIPMLLDLLLP